ncbi:unnamed protein product [Hermetia illucens]|uniref:Uncharacterized protein n=1 Tax=Hermetia illucens TaxID=343691 RepID=A0A7R8YM97_HERIL|nr:unnamed protein product [Hermetia illucens]
MLFALSAQQKEQIATVNKIINDLCNTVKSLKLITRAAFPDKKWEKEKLAPTPKQHVLASQRLISTPSPKGSSPITQVRKQTFFHRDQLVRNRPPQPRQ